MKINTPPVIALIIALSCLSILEGCKKNNLSKKQNNITDPPPVTDPVLPPDSAKMVYIGQKDYQDLPAGMPGTTISAYDAGTGALIHTFSYVHDPKAANIDNAIQYLTLQAGNGYLYDIEGDKINALDINTGTVRWTDSITNNVGAVLHAQTLYGISVGGLKSYNEIANADNFVYAISATGASNAFLWKHPISLSDVGLLNFPHMYKNIPAPFYYNGMVYVMADATHLIALDAATGVQRWSFAFPSGAVNPYDPASYVFTAPKFADGLIYCSFVDPGNAGQSTYIINAASGSQKALLAGSGTFQAIDGNLLITSNGAIDAGTKALKWTTNVGSVFAVWSSGIVTHRDTVYYYDPPSGYPHAGYTSAPLLCMYDIKTGGEKWKYGLDDGSGTNKTVLVNNTLFSCGFNSLNAIDMYTGKTKWSQNSPFDYSVDSICITGQSGTSYSPYTLWAY